MDVYSYSIFTDKGKNQTKYSTNRGLLSDLVTLCTFESICGVELNPPLLHGMGEVQVVGPLMGSGCLLIKTWKIFVQIWKKKRRY